MKTDDERRPLDSLPLIWEAVTICCVFGGRRVSNDTIRSRSLGMCCYIRYKVVNEWNALREGIIKCNIGLSASWKWSSSESHQGIYISLIRASFSFVIDRLPSTISILSSSNDSILARSLPFELYFVLEMCRERGRLGYHGFNGITMGMGVMVNVL